MELFSFVFQEYSKFGMTLETLFLTRKQTEMEIINKNAKLFIPIGVIATIIGYLLLLYKGYNLDKDITIKQTQAKALDSIISKLKEDSVGLSKNNSQLKEKIKQTDSTIASASKESNSVEQLRKKLGIPTDTYFIETSKSNTSVENAAKYEANGFKNLLDEKIDEAISSFTKSENSYNGYHQVYDITKYLIKKKGQMAEDNSTFWKTIYQEILSDYSWGMPERLKSEFQNKIR